MEKRAKAKLIQAEFVVANNELNNHKEVVKQKNRAEERRIEEFRQAKEQLVDLKKTKEQERFLEKQAIRQKLIDKQADYLKNMKSKEEQILDKQQKENELKKTLALELKTKRLAMMRQSIDDHSAAMMKNKQYNINKEKVIDKEFVNCYKERMKELVNILLICRKLMKQMKKPKLDLGIKTFKISKNYKLTRKE
jgi:hypothetical protein